MSSHTLKCMFFCTPYSHTHLGNSAIDIPVEVLQRRQIREAWPCELSLLCIGELSKPPSKENIGHWWTLSEMWFGFVWLALCKSPLTADCDYDDASVSNAWENIAFLAIRFSHGEGRLESSLPIRESLADLMIRVVNDFLFKRIKKLFSSNSMRLPKIEAVFLFFRSFRRRCALIIQAI